MSVTEYRGEVWQNGMLVALVQGRDKESIEREIAHYALIYGQDGPVETKLMMDGTERRLQHKNKEIETAIIYSRIRKGKP